jgi:hypothetical protein
MLKRFLDDYEPIMLAAEAYLAAIVTKISGQEQFIGNDPVLDKSYAVSVALTMMLDYLYHTKVETETQRARAETVLAQLNNLLYTKPC